MNILTLGNGFVANHLPYNKITDRIFPNNIFTILNTHKPDVLINAIGFCGKPNVDQCEEKKAETYLANVTIPSILAYECEKLNIHLIHIGSGCIFFGQSPNTINYEYSSFASSHDYGWKETDFANPKSYYSRTKYACDLILQPMSNVTTLRIRMPVSDKNDSRNFINKIKNYKKIIDIPNSMTMMSDLTRCIDWIAKSSKFGLYHVTNPQPITAAQVMREYQKYDPNHQFEIISEAQLDQLTIAKRSNCILNIDKLTNDGFFMTPSEEALTDCMKNYWR